MTVSTRHMTFRAALVAGAFGGVIVGGNALAQSTPVVRTAPTGSANNCCDLPQNQIIEVPGVRAPGASVVIGAGNAGHGYSTYIQQGQGQQAGVYYFNNGGGATVAPYESSVLNNLQVEGEMQRVTETVTEQVPVTEQYCAPADVTVMAQPVQAVCIDDKGAPHPASQVFGEERIDATYNGEVFRCMAGTSMQVTVGSYANTAAVFDGGRTFSCKKGESLNHSVGGQLSCAPEAPQRNCNERSLLRRYGPGLKTVSAKTPACIPTQRTVMKQVTRQVQVEKPISSSGRIVLDGGVGQNVY